MIATRIVAATNCVSATRHASSESRRETDVKVTLSARQDTAQAGNATKSTATMTTTATTNVRVDNVASTARILRRLAINALGIMSVFTIAVEGTAVWTGTPASRLNGGGFIHGHFLD